MPTRHHGLFSRGMPRDHNAKAACYIYGANEEGVDTGIHIEGEGVLFLGKTALKELTEAYGWSIEESDTLAPRVAALEQEVAFLERERDDFKRRAEALEEILQVAREVAEEVGE